LGTTQDRREQCRMAVKDKARDAGFFLAGLFRNLSRCGTAASVYYRAGQPLQFRCCAQSQRTPAQRDARGTAGPRRPCGEDATGAPRPSRKQTQARAPGRGKREPHVLAQYLPTLLFLIVATGIGVALIIVGRVLGPRRPSPEKLSPYECGFEAFEDARMKFDVRYYLIAIQFIVFDLEIIFIVPWTLVFQELGPRALVTMGLFVGMLFLGFVYVWKKGALEWE
jgi:NADH-quinone oxidoreductase subunit A